MFFLGGGGSWRKKGSCDKLISQSELSTEEELYPSTCAEHHLPIYLPPMLVSCGTCFCLLSEPGPGQLGSTVSEPAERDPAIVTQRPNGPFFPYGCTVCVCRNGVAGDGQTALHQKREINRWTRSSRLANP